MKFLKAAIMLGIMYPPAFFANAAPAPAKKSSKSFKSKKSHKLFKSKKSPKSPKSEKSPG